MGKYVAWRAQWFYELIGGGRLGAPESGLVFVRRGAVIRKQAKRSVADTKALFLFF